MTDLNAAVDTQEDVVFDDDLSFLDDLNDIIAEEAAPQTAEEILEIEVTGDDDELLASAVNEIETEEEMAELYASQDVEVAEPTAEVDGEAPVMVMSPEESVVAAEAPAPKAKTPRAPKAAGTRAERIISKLGGDAVEYMTLTPAWASKTDDEIKDDFVKIIDGTGANDGMAEYVGDKAVNLFNFMKTGGGLNAVTARGFDVLFRDGQLVGGDKGNIVTNLLSKPYSLGTARSQSNQLLQLFTDLEIGKRTSRGVVELNPESIVAERIKTLMGK